MSSAGVNTTQVPLSIPYHDNNNVFSDQLDEKLYQSLIEILKKSNFMMYPLFTEQLSRKFFNARKLQRSSNEAVEKEHLLITGGTLYGVISTIHLSGTTILFKNR